MATIYKTWPNDQHWSWATGISLGANEYISSVSISGSGYQDNTMDGCTLYFGGVQIAVVSAGYLGTVSGTATGHITSTSITCNRGEFSWRSEVTITYTVASSVISRTISKTVVPAGAGSFTVKKNGAEVSGAYSGDYIAVAANAAEGFVFNNWATSPANLIGAITTASTGFYMPDQNVGVYAYFLELSSGNLSTTNMTGGSSVTLSITMHNVNLNHKYNLSFGTGMSTGDVDVGTGVSSVTFTVPLEWSAEIPNATSKNNGTLTLKTYYGNNLLGSTTITGLTYNVPANVKPDMGAITASIARTIDGVTYADIGEVFAQNHCGVRVQASASGQQNATITSMTLKIGSYSGNKYNKTVLSGSIDFTSGLLGTAGTNTITVTATDSRGRTNSASVNITVSAYAKPSGSLQVWRVNSGGTTDDMGVYGMYQLTKQYSAIGNNTLTWTLAVSGNSANSPADTGDLLPGNRLEFSETTEYTVTLTLADELETTVIVGKLPSARFIIAFDSTGNKIGIMKFPNMAIPTGKNRTFELSDDTQFYIGNVKAEEYFPAVKTITSGDMNDYTGSASSVRYFYGEEAGQFTNMPSGLGSTWPFMLEVFNFGYAKQILHIYPAATEKDEPTTYIRQQTYENGQAEWGAWNTFAPGSKMANACRIMVSTIAPNDTEVFTDMDPCSFIIGLYDNTQYQFAAFVPEGMAGNWQVNMRGATFALTISRSGGDVSIFNPSSSYLTALAIHTGV